jgi:hypothetical protein
MKAACVRIEDGLRTDRDGPGVLSMPKRQAANYRNA